MNQYNSFAGLIYFTLLAGLLGSGTTARAVTFEIVDASEFHRIVDTNAVMTTNATIDSWLEGPTWIPSGGYLVFCDVGNNRLKKLVPPATLTDFQLPPTNTIYNGTLLDGQGQLLGCQAGRAGLCVAKITADGATPLVSEYNGLKFYSPNDLAVKSDGTIWFTDPGYNSKVGAPPQPGFQPGYAVYQFHPTNGNATCMPVITNGVVRPNGICFSADEKRLYVADTDRGQNNIRVYDVSDDNTVSGGRIFASLTNGAPDGIKCDVDGRLWSSGGEGVYIYAPEDGHLIGKIKFHRSANLCFGGPDGKTLYITAQPVVTSIPVLVSGAWLGK